MMKIEDFASCWKDLSYPAFGGGAKKIGSLSSETINGIIGQLDPQKEQVTEQWIRLIIALHFHLGKKAEFFLNDHSTTTLLSILEASAQQKGFQQSMSSALLVVTLLSLNATSLTVGVENQICATFLSTSPLMQKLLLPLVHRSFYRTLRTTSLTRQLFDTTVHKQSSDISYSPQIRLHALRHARPETIDELLMNILFRVDVAGRKPTLGSAPIAVLPNNTKVRTFSVLCFCDSMTESQLHHNYVFSGIREFLRKYKKRKRKTDLNSSSTAAGGGLQYDTCELLSQYLQVVLEQLTSFLSDARKIHVYSTQKSAGQNYVEAVACDVLSVACSLSEIHPQIGELLVPDVTGFMYLALRLSRAGVGASSGFSTEDIPEIISSGDRVVEVTQDSTGTPLLSCSVILQCLEFLIQTSELQVVKDSLDDLFGERMWSSYLAEDSSFAMQVCLLMYRNRNKLTSVLPLYGPRIVWLVSTQPHSLFPIVKRLLPCLSSPATSLDLLCRILFLPLVTFAWDFRVDQESPNGGAGASVLSFIEQLWHALNNWEVDALSSETPLVKLIKRHAYDFALWDAVHGMINEFSPQMLTGFRLIRPLLAQYFRCVPATPDTFQIVSVGYFFLVSPPQAGARSSVTDFLLEMSRWVAENNPSLAIRSYPVFAALIQQEFLPASGKAPMAQRWACVVFAMALTKEREAEDTQKHAASFFEMVHVALWEMVALAGTSASSENRSTQGTLGRIVSSTALRSSLHASSRSCFPHKKLSFVGTHSRAGHSTPDFPPPCGDYTVLNPAISWKAPQSVWTTSCSTTVDGIGGRGGGHSSPALGGIEFSEHMHALVVSLTILTRLCPNLRERGSICLANIVRTLSKSVTFANSSLMDTTRFCMKLLRMPPMSGCETLPLHALLGMAPS